MLPRTTSFALLLLAASTATSLTGCLDRTIVGGGEGGGDLGGVVATTGSAQATTSATATGGDRAAAVALFEGEAAASPCEWDPCPDDMLFLIGDFDGVTCSAPTGQASWVVESFSFQLGVPPALQRVGTYPLGTSDGVYLARAESIPGPGVGQGTVGAGYGSGQGTLEILAIDDASVSFRLSDLMWNVDADGEYTAARCGAASLPAEGISLTGATLPGGEGGAPAADPDAVTLVVGDTLAACGAEALSSCAGDDWQIAVTLPAAYLVPGMIDLDDPLVASSACGATQPVADTLEIVVVEDDELIVHFGGALEHATELEQDLRISRCPS